MNGVRKYRTTGFWRYFRANAALYVMSLAGLIYIIGYKIIPLFGLQLAFKKFSMFAGNGIIDSMIKSKWVGFEHFEKIFNSPNFMTLLGNTLTLSLLKLLITFPLPMILALILNEIKSKAFSRTSQTLIYMPHFLSWVIIHGIFITLLSKNGALNQVLRALNMGEVNYYTNPQAFRWLLVFTEAWKEAGWGAIVYLAALTGVDESLYDAAYVDGANNLQRLWHVTLPSILPTIMLMLLLRIGGILNAGTEQVLVMYNSTVYSTADILGTYIYRTGLGKLDFSTATALGLFESMVGFVLMVTSNWISRRTLGRSLW